MNSVEKNGKIIGWDDKGGPVVPDNPIISYIEGDGTGPDIWAAAKYVFDEAVNYVYEGEKRIVWHEVRAGEKAQKVHG
ncbi:MAG: NADP-dependent isocitrate dehydrogenase, partial [Pseudomonadota bacterium]